MRGFIKKKVLHWLCNYYVPLHLAVTFIYVFPAPTEAQPVYDWGNPFWAPIPKVPKTNKMSNSKVRLGRVLFYEKNLSKDTSMSCASCHQPDKAFTDGNQVSLGVTGQPTLHNTPTLTNIGYTPVFTWSNPRENKLKNIVLKPLLGQKLIELGMGAQKKYLINYFNAHSEYRSLFDAAFPDADNTVTIENMGMALATFLRTLTAFNSPYDDYKYNGNLEAISKAAQRGEKLFFSPPFNCFQCHQAPFFTDNYRHSGLPFDEVGYHNIGLYNLGDGGQYPSNDTGLHQHTGKRRDMGRFRTPTLRNIALTGPYMHDGSVKSLGDIIEIYARGGRLITKGPLAGDGALNPLKSSYIEGFRITSSQKQDIIDFLQSLTDRTLIQKVRLSD